MKTNPDEFIAPEKLVQYYESEISAVDSCGLTKREYFAALAMQSMIVSTETTVNDVGVNSWNEQIAVSSVTLADALIDALNEE